MERPGAAEVAKEPEGFPRIYAVAKWTIVIALVLLSILAAAFWTWILGGFAASGFRAADATRTSSVPTEITPECAWPYSVNDRNAEAMCRMFNRLTAEQRAQVLSRRN